MKQTAVEWLVNQILDNQGDIITNAFKYGIDLTGFVNQAKEMEEKQIEDAFYTEQIDEFGDEFTFEDYYNETFNKGQK